MNPDDYLDEISQMAVIALADELEDRLKRDTIDEVKESLGQFLVKVGKSLEEILGETVAKQNQIVKLLNDRLLSSETERTKLGQELERLKEKVNTALTEKAGAEKEIEAAAMGKTEAEKRTEAALLSLAEEEKKLHEANRINELLNAQLTACTEKLADAETLAEKVQSGKTQLEKKLAQVQENWEKYMEHE
jgi:chromosome segregation ATPase